MRKVLVLDTSILCVWLKINNMETCGPDANRWDYNRVKKKIDVEILNHTTFVLPLATIIETGNHIAQSNGDKTRVAGDFRALINETVDGNTPWATFTNQSSLWEGEKLKSLIIRWEELINTKHSLGDASIVDVVKYYSELGYSIEILTGDEGLKAHQPTITIPKPRRRE